MAVYKNQNELEPLWLTAGLLNYKEQALENQLLKLNMIGNEEKRMGTSGLKYQCLQHEMLTNKNKYQI